MDRNNLRTYLHLRRWADQHCAPKGFFRWARAPTAVATLVTSKPLPFLWACVTALKDAGRPLPWASMQQRFGERPARKQYSVHYGHCASGSWHNRHNEKDESSKREWLEWHVWHTWHGEQITDWKYRWMQSSPNDHKWHTRHNDQNERSDRGSANGTPGTTNMASSCD